MVSAGTYSSGAAALSLGLSVPETLAAQALGAIILAVGLTMNAAAGVKPFDDGWVDDGGDSCIELVVGWSYLSREHKF